ncbi:MAG TPA: aminotransferase class I/II-fold pyridoxal phosphate-dependent enzyme, partial [Planctomycetota bacterium]|nr:aminotransferase class I/II-fold pyridoxal phosphate-dependent enzyme [Planctomycetota bacterium]
MANKPLRVPFLDLAAHHRPFAAAFRRKLDELLESSEFILGGEVEAFEAEFARYLGVRHAVGVSNGTDALRLAFEAIGLGPGDEVIVPAYTFVATALGVTFAGGTPRFVDV